MNLVFVGYRCSGKTTVSKKMAALLSWPVVEVDRKIEEYFNCSVEEIIELYGFSHFRSVEEHFIRNYACQQSMVIDPGGGAILHMEAMQQLKQTSLVIFLDCSVETIHKRMQASHKRPPLTELDPVMEIVSVLGRRISLYRDAADVTIPCDNKSIDEVCNQICREVLSRIYTERCEPSNRTFMQFPAVTRLQ
jgi:shikimate kinase